MLTTTYIIENVCGSMWYVAARVKTWDGDTMVLRWAAAGLQEAEAKFRRIKGEQDVKFLIKALTLKRTTDYGKRANIPDALSPDATHVTITERALDELLDGIAIEASTSERKRRVH